MYKKKRFRNKDTGVQPLECHLKDSDFICGYSKSGQTTVYKNTGVCVGKGNIKMHDVSEGK